MRSDGLGAFSGATMSLSTFKPSERRFWFRLWTGGVVVFAAVDGYRAAQGDGSTFSDFTRTAFRTDTTEGKALFLTALFILARHILK